MIILMKKFLEMVIYALLIVFFLECERVSLTLPQLNFSRKSGLTSLISMTVNFQH